MSAAVRGSVDLLTPTGATGWAWADASPRARIPIEVRLRGETVAACIANRLRGDLLQAKIGDGQHAFEVVFPQPLAIEDLHLVQFQPIGFAGELTRVPGLGSGGNVDELQPMQVRGWLYDTESAGAVPFAITAGEDEIAAGWAEQRRPDVPNPGAKSGAVGFDVRLRAGTKLALPAALRLWRVRDGARELARVKEFTEFHPILRGELTLSAEPFCIDATLTRAAADGEPARFGVFSGGRLLADCDHARPTSIGEEGGLPVHRYRSTVRCLAGTAPARRFELSQGARVFAAELFADQPPVIGAIDGVQDGTLRGWALDVRDPAAPVSVAVQIDGIGYGRTATGLPRPDIAARHDGAAAAGFALPLDPQALGLPRLHIAAVASDAAAPFATWQTDVRLAPSPPSAWTLPAGQPAVTIVVPANEAPELLRGCIAALLHHTPPEVKLLVCDDGSTDPAMPALLDAIAQVANVAVHREPVRSGRVACLNLAISLAGRDDVIVVHPAARVAAGWFVGLRAAAYGSPRIAAAGAVSAGDLAIGAPAWLEPDGLSRLAAQAARRPTTAALPGSACLYLRRAAIDAVGLFDEGRFRQAEGEAADFSLRAAAAGWHSVVCDDVCVGILRPPPARRPWPGLRLRPAQILPRLYPEDTVAVQALGDPLAATRFRIAHAALRRPDPPRPRLLVALGDIEGAAATAAFELIAAVERHYDAWLLTCDAATLRLFRVHGRAPVLAEARTLAEPVRLPSHESVAYSEAAAALLRRVDAEVLHVADLARHGISLIPLARTLGMKVVLALSDASPVCPNTTLVDSDGRACGGDCNGRGARDCRLAAWPEATVPWLRDRFVHRWRRMMAQMLDGADACVIATPALRATLAHVFPAMATRPLAVIRPPRAFDRLHALADIPAPGEKLRVIVPGEGAAATGLDLIQGIVAHDRRNRVELHFIGAADPALARYGVLHPPVGAADLPDLIGRIRPALAALLPLWRQHDEGWLVDLWACGVPVLVASAGEPPTQVLAHGGGWVLASLDAAAVGAKLLEIAGDAEALLARQDEVRRWQMRQGRAHGREAMAGAYLSLYASLRAPPRQIGPAPPAVATGWVITSDAQRSNPALLATEPLLAPATALLGGPVALLPCRASALDDVASGPPALVVVQFNGLWDLSRTQAAALCATGRGFRLAFAILPGLSPPIGEAAAVMDAADFVILTIPPAAADTAAVRLAARQGLVGWAALAAAAAERPANLVSIVVTGHAAATPAERCVGGILAVTADTDYEIVIVDNGHEGGANRALAGLAFHDARVRVVERVGDDGLALARTLGAAHTRGAVLVFLDAAVEVADGAWLSRLRQTLDDDPTVGVVAPKLVGHDGLVRHPGFAFADDSALPHPLYPDLPPSHMAANRSRALQAVGGACLALRAADFIKLRGFDPGFGPDLGDADLCLRLREALHRTAFYRHDAELRLAAAVPADAAADDGLARRVFVDRWAGRTVADDAGLYAADGVSLRGYARDGTESEPALRRLTPRLML